ncbi:MAG: hypothetical protein IJ761_06980 [Bacteroidales bacterium]|nr:hypothetical protein [Bacteroidales bacterium]
MNTKIVKKIRNTAAAGLWTSVGVMLLTVLFYYASPYKFTLGEYGNKWALVAATVLAVLSVSMVLLTVRKRVPQLRQTDSIDEKLQGYAAHIKSVYVSMAAVVCVVCGCSILSSSNVLIMLGMVCVLVLFLNYPNIYRIKVDLGLDDETMRSLFGENYIPDEPQQ